MTKTRRECRAEAVERLLKIEYASSLGDPANDNGRTPVEVACGKQLMSYKDECYALINLLSEDECSETMIDDFWRGCGKCGYVWEYMYGIGRGDGPRFCPRCGAKVVRYEQTHVRA